MGLFPRKNVRSITGEQTLIYNISDNNSFYAAPFRQNIAWLTLPNNFANSGSTPLFRGSTSSCAAPPFLAFYRLHVPKMSKRLFPLASKNRDPAEEMLAALWKTQRSVCCPSSAREESAFVPLMQQACVSREAFSGPNNILPVLQMRREMAKVVHDFPRALPYLRWL